MSISSISEARFIEIQNLVGSPSDATNSSDYIERLKHETNKDNSLRPYLNWVVSKDHEEPAVQYPQDWLGTLHTADYSRVSDLVDLRTALSFGEVNYLQLVTSNDPKDYLLIATDSGAFGKFRELESPLELPYSGAQIHPALVELSTSANNTTSNQSAPPTFVLPIGRLLRIWHPKPPDLELIRDIANKYPKNCPDIEAFALSAWRSMFADESESLSMSQTALEIQPFVRQIALKLHAGLRPFELLRDKDIEKSRRQAWRTILQSPREFRDTDFAVVIDAVDPHHSVWLVHVHDQEWDGTYPNHEGHYFDARLRFDAAQIFEGTIDWLNSYNVQNYWDIRTRIEKTRIRGIFTIHSTTEDRFLHAVARLNIK